MKIALIQQSKTADIAKNKQDLARGIADAASKGAELVVLQELHNSLYFCQVESTDNFDLAEPIPGPSTEFYSQVAKDNNVVLVTSLFERRAAGLYHNTAVVFEKDGSIAGKYRKMHIPDDPAYYEKFYFTPGDLGFHPIETSVGVLGVQVCWACRCAGISGILKERVSWLCKALICSSTLLPSAGRARIPTRRKPVSSELGRPYSADMPLPMACL